MSDAKIAQPVPGQVPAPGVPPPAYSHAPPAPGAPVHHHAHSSSGPPPGYQGGPPPGYQGGPPPPGYGHPGGPPHQGYGPGQPPPPHPGQYHAHGQPPQGQPQQASDPMMDIFCIVVRAGCRRGLCEVYKSMCATSCSKLTPSAALLLLFMFLAVSSCRLYVLTCVCACRHACGCALCNFLRGAVNGRAIRNHGSHAYADGCCRLPV